MLQWIRSKNLKLNKQQQQQTTKTKKLLCVMYWRSLVNLRKLCIMCFTLVNKYKLNRLI